MLNIDDRLIKEDLRKMKPNAFAVLMAIAIHLNGKTSVAFPSNKRLQELTGLGRDAVESALSVLKEFGYLFSFVQRQKSGHFGKRMLKITTKFIKIWISADETGGFEDNEEAPYPEKPYTVEPLTDSQGNNYINKSNIGENANEYTFEQFWNDYDFKKGSKAKTLQKFKKLSAKDRQDIKETLPLYKVDTNTIEVAGPGWKPMRKYPEFYLSGRTWENFAERLAAQKAENETFAPEWSEQYNEYLGWVERCYPKSLNAAKFLSKQQYVRYKTTFYVEGKSFIDEKREREFLIQAHEDVEKNDDLRARVTDIFSYHCELIKERLKMYQI